jgi:hypothetical protein
MEKHDAYTFGVIQDIQMSSFQIPKEKWAQDSWQRRSLWNADNLLEVLLPDLEKHMANKVKYIR